MYSSLFVLLGSLARYGWECIAKDTLQCTTCQSMSVITFPVNASAQASMYTDLNSCVVYDINLNGMHVWSTHHVA